MTQSQIAIKAAQILMLESEVLYKWKCNGTIYGIFGQWQPGLDAIKDAVEMATKKDLFNRKRNLDIIDARRLFVFFAMNTIKGIRLHNLVTYTNFHHATVIHHNKKMKGLIEANDHDTIQSLKKVCSLLHMDFVKASNMKDFKK